MCGIAGASLSPTDRVNAKRVAKAMLLAIEHRGMDATGFAFRDSTGTIQVHKDNQPASLFVKKRLCLPKSAKTFIMHTRFGTQGSELFNENNHPIATAGIVGVHNGCISNDYSLFNRIDAALELPIAETIRIGEVDSEAIFALLGYLDVNGAAEKLLEDVRGSAAIAWMNEQDADDTLYLARISSSPLVIGTSWSGSLFFASTEEAVRDGAAAAGVVLERVQEIAEGQYASVLAGEYTDVRSFEPPKGYSYDWRKGYRTIGTSAAAATTRGITDRMSAINRDWDDDDDFFLPAAHPNMTHDERTYAYIMGREAAAAVSRDNVTSLSERLAQEEPDIMDYDDEGGMNPEERVAYEEWWNANAAACDEAIDNDDERARRQSHKEFAEYLDAPSLNSYYLSNIEYPVAVPGIRDYLAVPAYSRRDDAVEAYMGGVVAPADAKARTAVSLKADALPGQGVTTEFAGSDVFGHLVALPETFPSGDYLIRAYIPNVRRKLSFEAVFIARKYHEFNLSDTGTQDVPKKGTAVVKVLDNGHLLPGQQALSLDVAT